MGLQGVGNASLPVTSYISARQPNANIIKKGNFIIDNTTNKKLIEIKAISQEKFQMIKGNRKFAKTRLGSVKGLEFLPSQNANR